jgi:putative hydrolase of the HAD superfamily
MSAAPPIDAVLFDYGLVLSGPPNPGAWARMIAFSGVADRPLHAAYWAHRHDYDRGALKGAAYWQAVAAHAETAFTGTQIEQLTEADNHLWGDLNTPIVDWVARLQRAGIRTGILSNIGDAIAHGLNAMHPFIAGFDHATWSHALGLAKPDPQIYRITAAALKTPPARILFLDDREDNIAAANALGFQGIQYTGQPAFEAEMLRRGLDGLLHIGQPALEPAAR